MYLEEMGFYTLSEARAMRVSWDSPLKRCELLLTDACNFRCPYCRGVKPEYRGSMSFDHAKHVVDLWASHGLENIRFSGGEPTLWSGLLALVQHTRQVPTIKRVAVSSNGSADITLYDNLIKAGVNDFSISYDACCASTAEKMAGRANVHEHVRNVIRFISERVYCTVGVVIDETNLGQAHDTIKDAVSLGVSDVRIIPSAQYNRSLAIENEWSLPILRFKLDRMQNGYRPRGLTRYNTRQCHLVKDDMAVIGNYHFPCIIYLREGGMPIGTIQGKNMNEIRAERKAWFEAHDSHSDPICKNQCLDFCSMYNNAVQDYTT